jgi:acyl-coenzyme A thioesterase PaaI-like protein
MTAPEGLVPKGFERHTRRSGLTEPWEPIYARRSTHGVSLAIRASAAHANSRGFVHGGLITALADTQWDSAAVNRSQIRPGSSPSVCL